MGTPVKIHGSNRYWLQISTPDYKAWTTDMGIVPMDSVQLQEYTATPKYICTVLWSEVFAEPKKDAARISDLVMGDLMRVSMSHSGKALKSKGFLGVVLPVRKKRICKRF